MRKFTTYLILNSDVNKDKDLTCKDKDLTFIGI